MTHEKNLQNHFLRAFFIAAACLVIFYLFHVITRYKEFHRQLSEFNTVKLTDHRTDVIYRLGRPTSVYGPLEVVDKIGSWQRVFTVDGPAGDKNTIPTDKKLEDFDDWGYENVHGSSRLTVSFGKAGQVQSLNWYCDNEAPLGWGPVAGIRHGDSEDKVLGLGHPSNSSIKDTIKKIEYSDIGLEFHLTKGKVYMVTLTPPLKGEGAMLWRFIHTLP